MIAVKSAADFCRYSMVKSGRFVTDPVRLGAIFREYANLEGTPDLKKTVEFVRGMGIKIQAVKYLETGGVNMVARKSWHVHYSAKDKPATQKFDILHELFEVIHKSFNTLYPDYPILKEPYLSRYADRFASGVLIPQRFFLKRLIETGCDLVKLGEDLELSYQCLLVAMRQHLGNISFVGALYDYHLQEGIRSRLKTNDYITSLVVKTGAARSLNELCWLQPAPIPNEPPKTASLVCAALYGNYSILYRGDEGKNSHSVLVRLLSSNAGKPYRVILLALPSNKISRFSPQIDSMETIIIDEDSPCPSSHLCLNSPNCRWKNHRRS
jgi:Zn-dependent peptidase ImmA (M78 family)